MKKILLYRRGSILSKDASQASRAGSQESKRSHSGQSRRSGSVASNRSGSQASNRSGSQASNKSDRQSRSGSRSSYKSGRSRSGSIRSNKSVPRSRSGSLNSNRSTWGSRSASQTSNRSGGRSRSASAGSKDSRRSGSQASNRSRSGSRRSRSGSSVSKKSNRPRSGSRSAASSRSGSADSRKSGNSIKSKSRSRSGSKSDRSRSTTPNLEIDEGPAEKKKVSDDEENEGNVSGQKKLRVIDSDSETEAGKEVSAAAIFGDDADDISSEEEKEKQPSDKEDRSPKSDDDDEQKSDTEQNKEEGDVEKENEPEPIPETRIDVEIPKISCDLGRDIHFVKLPNFLSVETRPFDPETYEDEIDEEETLDEEGRARLKLKVENTVRWREVMDEDGNIKKESNARIVRWSDGSYSLHLGSEIFDVYKQPLQGDHNHLFIRQGTGLQGQAVFRTKLSFRPHSTESFTHRKMTLSLADRSQKTSGIKILSQVGVDPDQDRYTRLKKEEEKLRQSARASKPRAKKENTRSLNSSRGEEDGSDDEGAISLNAIKNKYKQGGPSAKAAAATIYSSDEDGSDIEMKSKKQGKVLNIEESDEDSD
ncbi:hypothetical protein WA026_003488 [Henosepilachna vigintioctopunctata]|uniref:Another transcription unit protein n=1 Tax=Henosepilachna vigintioctopunctata TaxID=420089 RepID=A0AAW1THK5_9CUCU